MPAVTAEDIDPRRIATALMPTFADLWCFPLSITESTPGNEVVMQIVDGHGNFMVTPGPYDCDDLVRRVNECGVDAPDIRSHIREIAQYLVIPSSEEAGLYAQIRRVADMPANHAKQVRRLAAVAMVGITKDQLLQLIGLLVAETAYGNPDKRFSWYVHRDNDYTYRIVSEYMGLVAWGLSENEVTYLMQVGVGFFARRQANRLH
jgi:hypothetical protein